MAKNGRIKVRRREAWEGFAHRFNIAAGFSPAREREILRDTFLKILKSTQTMATHQNILYLFHLYIILYCTYNHVTYLQYI